MKIELTQKEIDRIYFTIKNIHIYNTANQQRYLYYIKTFFNSYKELK